MRAPTSRTLSRFIRHGGLVLAVLGMSLIRAEQESPAAQIPPPPVPPPPPIEADLDLGASFRVPPGQTHKGDVYRIRGAVDVEGTLEGDLTCLAGSVRVPGRVTGDIFAAGSRVEITGSAGDSVRLYAGDVVIDGPIDGELIVSGGSIRLGPKAVVKGDAQIYAKDIIVEGNLTSDLLVRAGIFELRGTVGGNADIVVERITLAPGARIAGDLDYSSRDELDLGATKIVGGTVSYKGQSEESSGREEPAARREHDSSSGGLPGRIFRFIAALLAYSVTIRIARNALPHIKAAADEALQSTGVGFIALLTPFAAVITAIGIVTIPLVILYLFLWAVAFYLSGIGPALWIGRFALGKLNRPEASVYGALALGLAILYLAYGIPVLGWIAWGGVSLWGLGSLVIGSRSYWAARRGAAPPPRPAAEPPPAASPA